MVIENEANEGQPASDNAVSIGGYVSNGSYFGWDSRNGQAGGHSTTNYSDGYSTGPWTHYSIVGDGNAYRFYINGYLRATQTPIAGAYLTCLDSITIVNGVSNAYSGVVREPLDGVDVVLPVADNLQHACAGYNTIVDGMVSLAEVDDDTIVEKLGQVRAFSLPRPFLCNGENFVFCCATRHYAGTA